MPGSPALSNEATLGLTRYLLTGEDIKIAPEKAGPATLELKYTIDGYNRFLDRDGTRRSNLRGAHSMPLI